MHNVEESILVKRAPAPSALRRPLRSGALCAPAPSALKGLQRELQIGILVALIGVGCMIAPQQARAQENPTTPGPAVPGPVVPGPDEPEDRFVVIGQELVPQPDGTVLVFKLVLDRETGKVDRYLVGVLVPEPEPRPLPGPRPRIAIDPELAEFDTGLAVEF